MLGLQYGYRCWNVFPACHKTRDTGGDSFIHNTLGHPKMKKNLGEWVEFNAPIDTIQVISEAEKKNLDTALNYWEEKSAHGSRCCASTSTMQSLHIGWFVLCRPRIRDMFEYRMFKTKAKAATFCPRGRGQSHSLHSCRVDFHLSYTCNFFIYRLDFCYKCALFTSLTCDLSQLSSSSY